MRVRGIDELHEERGEAALGRVLTLLISTNEASLEHDLEVANSASREHPCRVIAIAPNSRKMDADTDDGQPHTFLDAEVRFGSDAGAGEIIDIEGNVIPHLYSAGEFGSVWSGHYQGGGNLGECLAFGRIAARSALANE